MKITAIFITLLITWTLLVSTPFTLSEPLRESSTTYVYQCRDGFEFVVNIQEETAWLFLPDQTIDTHLTPAASGARYQGADVIFWNKGDEAILSIGSDIHKNCSNDHSSAIWEDAKLRGIDFRAVGNEPGWHLELDFQQIRFVGDYGSVRERFPTPSPETDQANRRTLYRTRNRDFTIELLLEGRKCHDTMSDAEFETSVTILLNEKKYQGCGRALH